MRIIMVMLAVCAGVLAGVSVVQWRQKANLEERVATLVQESDQRLKQLEDLEATRLQSERERAQLLQTSSDLEYQLRTQQLTASTAATAAKANVAAPAHPGTQRSNQAGLGNFLGKLMQDPDTKEFIRNQQRMMMNQMYAPLLKQLDLTADEASQFKDLLADNAMKMAEKATSMLDGSVTNRAELGAAMAADQKNFEDQLRTFLGEDRLATFQQYQETVADRTQLTMFKQQSASTEHPINDAQTEQLLDYIREERRNVAAATGLSLPGTGQEQQSLELMVSPEHADKLLQSQESVNQRVFERARTVLSPDQLQSFGAFQTNQMQMMRMGLSMARRFVSPAPSENTAPVLNP